MPPPGVPPQEPQWASPNAGQRDGRSTSFFVAIFLGLLLLVSGALNVLLLVVSIGSFATAGLGGAIDDTGGNYDVVRIGGDEDARDKVLRIPIQGVIAEADNVLLGAGGGLVTSVRRALRFAAADPGIKGILLDIDSPGGGVTDSDEIYRMIREFRVEHPNVHVLALFGDVAASGGYYIAVAAEHIMARRTSLTGSIGVIMSAWNFAEAADKLGVSQVTITSPNTPYKDMLSPTRPVTEAERQILTSIVEDFYQQFVDVVDRGRPSLSREQVLELANGSVYSATQAAANGLVDQLGGMPEAEEWFRQKIGAVQVLEYRRRVTLFDMLFGARAPEPPRVAFAVERLLQSGSGPRFLYYWQGAR